MTLDHVDEGTDRRSRARVGMVMLAVALCAVLAALHSAQALADEPQLLIETPNGSVLRESTPTFVGVTSDTANVLNEFDPVIVEIENVHTGAQHTLTVNALTPPSLWSGTAPSLVDGVYTATATQTERGNNETGKSKPVFFTIDTTRPHITLTQPANGAPSSTGTVTVAGSAGEESGDSPLVSLALFAGSAVSQTPLQTLVLPRSSESWSTTLAPLAPGTYTVQATQHDAAGNTGTSAPATFTVLAPPAPPPPRASFSWVPAAPVVGESVTLISSSSDLASPMTGFAWALSPGAPFAAGSPVLTTLFSTVGAHVVRLDVTDAAGRSAVATESLSVRARPAVLMAPFPVVRVAGSLTRRGALIKLLSVQVPLAARVTIRCRGHGCKTKAESRIAVASSKTKPTAGLATLSFPRFQRSLAAGVVLEIRVSKEGEIGKYTRLRIRSQRPPLRTDACLNAASPTPIPCPAS